MMFSKFPVPISTFNVSVRYGIAFPLKNSSNLPKREKHTK